MRSRRVFSRLAAVAVLVFGVGLSSCTPDWADEEALTRLVFNGVTSADGGAFLSAGGQVNSMVQTIINDEIVVNITNDAISPNIGGNELYDVILDGYTVEWARTDPPGTATPAAVSKVFAIRIPVNANRGIALTLLDPLQKFAAPLGDLNQFGFERATGFPEIQTIATIHLYGHNLKGDKVDVEFDVRVSFCLCEPV